MANNLKFSVVLLDDAVYDGQAKARPRLFGRIKWFKYLIQFILWNAIAGVLKTYYKVIAEPGSYGYFESPTVWHSLNRVQSDIKEGLSELAFIDVHF